MNSYPTFLDAIGEHHVPLLVSYCDERVEKFYSFSEECKIDGRKFVSPKNVNRLLKHLSKLGEQYDRSNE